MKKKLCSSCSTKVEPSIEKGSKSTKGLKAEKLNKKHQNNIGKGDSYGVAWSGVF